MKLCAVYKSSKKDQTYLYVPGKDDFSKVPEALMTTFGTPLFVMLMPLLKKRQLPLVDFDNLVKSLVQQGFYLQLPPPPEDLLKAHLQQRHKAKAEGEL